MGDSKEPDFNSTMGGVMEYYVNKYFDFYKPKLRESLRKLNVYADQELLESYMEQAINNLKDEIAEKFNAIALLVLDNIISGRIAQVRMFEERFVDLLERTLLKDQDTRPAEVTIIIPEFTEPLDDKE